MAKMESLLLEASGEAGKTLSQCAASFTRKHIKTISNERVSTGFPALDRGLNGGLSNGLYVLGAVPGLGKSTLALQISYYLSSKGIPVLYFALEMNRIWITAKSLCRADFAQYHHSAFQASDLLDSRRIQAFSPDVWSRIDEARAAVERDGANFFLYEQGPNLTHIGQIRTQIQGFQEQHRARGGTGPIMVVIDYLQILAPRDAASKLNDKQLVDDNVRELCKIRDQDQVIVLLISALNRTSYNRAITMDSFKESGSIEYSADVILGMQYKGIEGRKFDLEKAKKQSPRQLELTLLKMRYGQDGLRIPLQFYNACSYFQPGDGAEPASPTRLQELKEQFRTYKVQYHDGHHQKACLIKGCTYA